jgi:hypothetical protein
VNFSRVHSLLGCEGDSTGLKWLSVSDYVLNVLRHYSSQCRALLNTELIFRVKKMKGYFLRSSEITSFSRR